MRSTASTSEWAAVSTTDFDTVARTETVSVRGSSSLHSDAEVLMPALYGAALFYHSGNRRPREASEQAMHAPSNTWLQPTTMDLVASLPAPKVPSLRSAAAEQRR